MENRRKRTPDQKNSKTTEKRSTFSKKKPDFKTYKKSNPKNKVIDKIDDGSVRLNRYLANAGVCSRREADEFITLGLVKINGKLVKELGTKVFPGDEVKFNDAILKQEKKVYILLNKPKDYITTTDDEKGRKSILELIRGACRERVYPVGRLDRNTTGIILLTNDGELSSKLTHPKYNKKKIYHVFLDKKVKLDDIKALEHGIELEDGFIKADTISYVDASDKSQVGVEIHSGRNRIIRRMFEHLEYKVIRLDRVYFAGLTKKSLPRGRWRFLTHDEISMLKMGAYE